MPFNKVTNCTIVILIVVSLSELHTLIVLSYRFHIVEVGEWIYSSFIIELLNGTSTVIVLLTHIRSFCWPCGHSVVAIAHPVKQVSTYCTNLYDPFPVINLLVIWKSWANYIDYSSYLSNRCNCPALQRSGRSGNLLQYVK